MLSERYRSLKAHSPRTRARDAAATLGVTEAELVQQALGGQRLAVADWPAFVEGLRALGPVMALTRNDMAVHEREGAFLDVRMDNPHVGGVYGPDIDLRLFPACWDSLFAVDVDTPKGPRPSLQLYDRHGVAVQKLYAVDGTDRAAWGALVASLGPSPALVRPTPEPAPRARGDAPAELVQARWAAMRDTHDLHGLLGELGLRRDRALELVDGRFAWSVPTDALGAVLHAASSGAVPIMVFVANRGCIQIHSGPVQRVVATDGWMNVLDPGFNLHVRVDAVCAAWVVHKPTDDGIVSSLELIDAQGAAAVQLFGVRKPGLPEDPRWRACTDALVAARG
jgi:putative hemin transport protein